MESEPEGEEVPLLHTLDQSKASSLAANSSSQMASTRSARFNLLFLKRFWLVMRVVHPRLCSKSLVVLILLIFTRAAEEYNYYLSGLIPSRFYAALDSRDNAGFKEALWVSAIIVTSVCVCKSGGELVAGLLYVKWRGRITRHLHSLYFRGISYYLLNFTNHEIDNPDQRITQDVDKFCNQMSVVVPKVILSPFVIGYYTYKTYQTMGYLGPVSIYAFFAISTVINKFIMGPIISLVFRQEILEGNFRFHHVQVRSKAESIAFYQGGKLEGEKVDKKLNALLRTQLSVVHWQFPLNLSVNIFDYVSFLISYSLVGIAVFSGVYDSLEPAQLSAVVSQNAFISLYLLNNFSTLVDQATAFTDIAGYTHRIGEMLEVLKSMDTQKKVEDDRRSDSPSLSGSAEGQSNPSINSERGKYIHPAPPQCTEVAAVIKDLSVAPPRGNTPLVERLNLEFRRGKNILLLGDSGSGKSSILRVLRGLWKPLRGSAKLCPDSSHHYVLFLPQKPFLTSGSLADQVTFPEKPKQDIEEITYQGHMLTDDRITEALRMSGLVYLRDRLGGINVETEENWYDIVSPGEMQKIAFARLFFHKPPFAVLDEATCALSEENEECFYSTLQQLGITVLSVGHRSSLRKLVGFSIIGNPPHLKSFLPETQQHHHLILVLNGNRTWQLQSCTVPFR